ncbi:MAG TPA: hypothetical protein VEJ63_15275 [Planctomycetota bacterium]|nr:hypothetical protein [Planctomycetota bacterium]
MLRHLQKLKASLPPGTTLEYGIVTPPKAGETPDPRKPIYIHPPRQIFPKGRT